MPFVVGSLDEYVSVCCRCGCALKEQEMSAKMQGTLDDLDMNIYSDDAVLVFCPECKASVRKYATEPVRKAWLRMQVLEHP